MSYWGFVKRIFCTKVASFSKYFSSMLNSLSIFLITLPFGVNLPTSSAPSIFSTLKVVSMGPSPPISVEYTCQPLSIVAWKMISASVPSPIFNSDVKCTGSTIWACIPRTTIKVHNVIMTFFMLLLYDRQ